MSPTSGGGRYVLYLSSVLTGGILAHSYDYPLAMRTRKVSPKMRTRVPSTPKSFTVVAPLLHANVPTFYPTTIQNMKTKTISFLIVLWSDRIKAFQPLHRGQHAGCRSSSSTAVVLQASQHSYEEDIERLMSDYQKLQKQLWADIRQIHRMDALKDLEGMMEKAVDMTALKRFQQEERLMEAEKLEANAASKVDYAQQLKEKSKKERQWAQDELALVESIEDGYEDLERLRDMSVAHAASQVEKDANEL